MTDMISIEERRSALKRTADWLRAHPDNVCFGELATDAFGATVYDPRSSKAECFCFLGRLVVEADLVPDQNDPNDYPDFNRALDEYLAPLGTRIDDITNSFDSEVPFVLDKDNPWPLERSLDDRLAEVRSRFPTCPEIVL